MAAICWFCGGAWRLLWCHQALRAASRHPVPSVARLVWRRPLHGHCAKGAEVLRVATAPAVTRATLVVDLVADDVLLHGEAERAPVTDLAVVGLEILYLDSLRIENINVPREGYRATNKDGGEDVTPGRQPEEGNKEDNGGDTNKEGVTDAEKAKDHIQVNNRKGNLEVETKKDDADDRKKEQLPDAEKTEDCQEGSKEQ
ncbi:hypothetical protein E2562_021759 [Oryza meyeriana var. granulata]|uniref:Uncharacterized protein n=1 Tax=Oryza meyeriana var. granulata TaxID=110450 RepID=A0A6G1EXV3_9ORYZ|nr:hypothetical protein E2562_021759 [Oryza meyeriana var. granulata]